MNFYYDNYYDSDHDHGDGGYYPNPYDPSGNFAAYNDYNPHGETGFFDQVPARYYYTPYGYVVPPQPTVSYLASTFSHSDLITIHPNAYYSSSDDPKSTGFAIGYSTAAEFNEPDFEEYDPTPYGGGYDPSATYGKPLPPSAEICYPHSARAQDAAPAPLGGVRDGIPELPIAAAGDERARKPGAGSEIVPAKIDQEAQDSSHQTEEDSGEDIDHRHEDHQESEQSYSENSGYSPWGVYGGGFQGTARPALDAWDICDGVFGYWPCLSRDDRRSYGVERIADGEYGRRNEDQWQGAVDFLFGSTNPYAERRHDSQVSSGHYYAARAHERQSEGQLYYEQAEYEHHGDSNPW